MFSLFDFFCGWSSKNTLWVPTKGIKGALNTNNTSFFSQLTNGQHTLHNTMDSCGFDIPMNPTYRLPFYIYKAGGREVIWTPKLLPVKRKADTPLPALTPKRVRTANECRALKVPDAWDRMAAELRRFFTKTQSLEATLEACKRHRQMIRDRLSILKARMQRGIKQMEKRCRQRRTTSNWRP